jgi:hypothetical protein
VFPECHYLYQYFLVFINNPNVQAALVIVIRKSANNTKLGQAMRMSQERELLQASLDKMTA